MLALSFLLLLFGSFCTQNDVDFGCAKVTAAKNDARTIAGAVRMFALRHRRLPALAELSKSFDGGEPMLDHLPKDPWLHEYVLRAIGPGLTRFEVVSMGPDGVLDTDDDIRWRWGG